MPALVVAALAASGGSAQAVVRLGPDVTPPSGIGSGGLVFAGVGCQPAPFSPCSFVNLRSTNAEVPVAAPSDGVITRWRFRVGCCGLPAIPGSHTLTLATFRQGTHDGDFGYAYVIPTGTPGPAFEVPDGNQLQSEPPVSVPVRMPIRAGERVGIVGDNAFFIAVYGPAGVTAADIANGYVDRGEGYGTARPGVAWSFNVDVEPDADADGYGDETQDCLPGDPSRQGDCTPPPAPTPPAPISVAGGSSGPSTCGNSCPSKGAAPIIIPPVAPVPSGDGRRVYIELSCPPAATKPCGGFLVLSLPLTKKANAAATTTLGRVAYSVAPGKTKRVAVTLSKAGRALLKRRGKLTVRVTARPEGGAATTVTRTLRWRAPKRGR